MSPLVVDASVLVKLFIAEEGSRDAAAAVKRADALAAPDLLWAEVGNTLWKYVRRGDLSAHHAEQIAADMLQTPIEIAASGDLIESALTIAVETDRSVYDCLYLALAVRRQCRLLTADARLVSSLAATRFARHVRHVAKSR
ncbi:MAG: PIN domain nuclease [Planctomycetota bacterium]|nr:MAG: PIN domain nuclease [Planctomycetota bacterium]